MKDREELARVLSNARQGLEWDGLMPLTQRSWLAAADAAVAWCAQRMLAEPSIDEVIAGFGEYRMCDGVSVTPVRNVIAARRADWTAQEDAAVSAVRKVLDSELEYYIAHDMPNEKLSKIVAAVREADAARAKGAR